MNSSSTDNAIYDAAFTSHLAPQTVNRDPGPPPNYSNGVSAGDREDRSLILPMEWALSVALVT